MIIRHWDRIVVSILLIGDIGAFVLAARAAGIVPFAMSQAYWHLSLGIILLGLMVVYKLYTANGTVSRMDEAVQITRLIVPLTILIILITTFTESELPEGSRGFTKFALIFGILIVGFRWVIRSGQKYLFRYHLGTRKTVIVGTTEHGASLLEHIKSQPQLGYEPLGFVTYGNADRSAQFEPIIGHVDDLPTLIKTHDIKEVILTQGKPEHESLLSLVAKINGTPVEIKILPDMYEVVTGLARTEQIYGLPLIRINSVIITPSQLAFKRLIDITISATLLALCTPVILICGVLVKLETRGPMIFSQERVGLRSKPFTIRKIRTMVADAETATGPIWAREDDPRITRMGEFLRKTRIDEIPQLWNVLMGDMSLVGPRPERPHFVEWLTNEFPYYHRRLGVRPGITGWAQVNGNYDSSLADVRRKLKDDFFYIENLSAVLDLKIMIKTVRVMLGRKGL